MPEQSRPPTRPATRLERLMIPGPAGRLEALLEREHGRAPRLAALVCHPHPLFGGTMHNKVVFRAAKAAVSAGAAALRFNYRGVGASEGESEGGAAEQDDVRAALDALAALYPATPLCLIGFSFGASVGLAVGAPDRRVEALVGLGLPTTTTDFGFLGHVAKPKLIVQGTEDVYGPRAAVESLFQSLAQPKRIHWVEAADHFFTGRLDEVERAIREFLDSL